MQQARRASGATVIAALVGLCVLAGCSNSHGGAVGHPTTTSVPASTTTPDHRGVLDHDDQLDVRRAVRLPCLMERFRARLGRRQPV